MILITRPAEAAERLQLKFHEIGIQSCIESLTSIQIGDRKINLQDCIYLITSQYAVEYLKNKKISHLINKTEFVVIGQATSKKLLKIGVKKIIYTAEDSIQLLQYLKKTHFQKRIIYLCGSNREPTFIGKLKKLHKDVSVRQVYKVVSLKTLSKNLITNLRLKKISIVLIFSLNNAKLFIKLCKISNKINYVDLTYICMSQNIYKFMIQNSCKNATYSLKPTEKSVIKKTLDLMQL